MRAQPGYRRGPQSTPALVTEKPYKRQVKNIEDYYENLDGRYGYCFCGCGERTNVPEYTQAQRGQFKGEPNAFLQGHHIRQRPPRPTVVSDETVMQIRYLWCNTSMSQTKIGEIVGLSGGYVGAIGRNESLADPCYTPPTRQERLRLSNDLREKSCAICGSVFLVSPSQEKNHQKATCGEQSCKDTYRRMNAARISRSICWDRERRDRASEQAKARHAAGVYENKTLPPTTLQKEFRGKLPETRPDNISAEHWEALVLHVNDNLSYEECGRRYGGSSHKYKYRAYKAAKKLRESSKTEGR